MIPTCMNLLTWTIFDDFFCHSVSSGYLAVTMTVWGPVFIYHGGPRLTLLNTFALPEPTFTQASS